MGAEELPERLVWSGRDWLALATIPLIFAVAFSAQALTTSLITVGVIDTVLRIAICVLLVLAYRQLLARHWRRFLRAKWRGIALVLGGAVLTQVIISAVAAVMPQAAGDGIEPPDGGLSPETATGTQLLLLCFLSLGPIVTAFIEDTVFRHTLLIKLPVWRTPVLAVLLVLGNAVLFGAVHYYNFGSFAGTVPYMAAGLFFNLVYLWTRNIWHVLLMHVLNNAVLTLGGLLLIAALRPFIG